MSSSSLIERVVASLHAAVFDDSIWPETAVLIDEACKTKGSILVAGDGCSRHDIEIFFAKFYFGGERCDEWERDYFELYYPIDERIPRLGQLPDGEPVHVSSLFTDEEKKTSVIYNELLPSSDTGDSLVVHVGGSGGSRILWSLADPTTRGGWSFTQRESIKRLLPHIRQFVHVRQALVDAQALGETVTAMLENTRRGVIHLDPRARIVQANDYARALLRKSDGLRLENGLLRASTAAEDGRLQALLRRALPSFGAQGAGGSMTIGGGGVVPGFVLHVTPVDDRWTNSRPSRVAALVLVADPMDRVDADECVISSLLTLTPAQSRVAVSLAQGSTIRDIAFATGRREATIRWHIKHIFAKLGISRQVELVDLVRSIMDLPYGDALTSVAMCSSEPASDDGKWPRRRAATQGMRFF